ncbi:MAG: hypothetical protein K1000chlam2_00053 [Chlamydiae bacterium]|nr:hypothetical protein [Chlamydiota bacterium]
MKVYAILFLIFFTNAFAICPLNEEEEHFFLYRTLIMENSVYNIEKILHHKKMDPKLAWKIQKEVDIIKFNLGICEDISRKRSHNMLLIREDCR